MTRRSAAELPALLRVDFERPPTYSVETLEDLSTLQGIAPALDQWIIEARLALNDELIK